ncbi:lectin subunit alpha-like isoform X1 [Lucilia sericata]|uniref:lectin subunit alpha-like isoform X1 n=1 Tax=Lucilia sericata TaxID=13632 RepID=UPI0018A850BD|nr:lectin subunit alpha-like isoform X1 [Lucilia sericata]
MKITQVFVICCLLLGTVSGSPQLHKASDGREYLIETELKYNWYQAWHECARRDFQLVIIDNAAKNTAIINLLKRVIGKSHNLWLGGNDEFSSSRDYKRPFFWSATGKQFTFSFWSDNNPDNYQNQEHCVHIWASKPLYQWNDVGCTNKMGFICEVNHYKETYNKDLKNKCDVIKKTSSGIAIEFDQTKKQQLSEIDSKLQNIDRMGDDWKIKMQQLQNTTQAAVQKLLDEQQVSVKQLTEKMLKEVSDLNVELKKSATQLSSQFGEKLNGSFSFPWSINNLIVIKQGG